MDVPLVITSGFAQSLTRPHSGSCCSLGRAELYVVIYVDVHNIILWKAGCGRGIHVYTRGVTELMGTELMRTVQNAWLGRPV